jgi:hypothetical protein
MLVPRLEPAQPQPCYALTMPKHIHCKPVKQAAVTWITLAAMAIMTPTLHLLGEPKSKLSTLKPAH